MSFVIDGHNLIGVMPGIELSDPDDELRLLAHLRAHRAQAQGQDYIVFFDGPASLLRSSGPATSASQPASVRAGAYGRLAGPGLEVRFAKQGQTADDAIIAFLRSRPAPGQYAVVTDDRELAARARFAGASAVSAREFAAKILRPAGGASRARRQAKQDGETAPSPKDPAFADIYHGFMAAEKTRARLEHIEHASFSAWVERLNGPDAALAQRATRWLGQFGGAGAVTPLQEALAHPDAGVRAGALLALGDLGNPAAVPDLCECLINDGNSMARQAAAQSLARIGDRRAVAVLEAAAQSDSKSKVRKAALTALAQIRARQK